jgi:alanyl-tRNA synthetase
LREVYGKAVDTLGAMHGPPKAYTIYKANSPDQVMLNSIEKIANEVVQENKGVNIIYVDAAKLSQVAVNAPNLDRLPASDRYRVVIIEGVNGIPCTGTHVKKTGEVGYIKVLGIETEQEGFKLYYDAEP